MSENENGNLPAAASRPPWSTERQMDALLAEQVMGWGFSPTGTTWRVPDGSGMYRNGWNHKSFVRSWRPCSDPADSKMIRDKMIGNGYAYQVTYLAGEFRACFWIPPLETYFNGSAGTEEMAVALAAFKVVLGVDLQGTPSGVPPQADKT